MLNGISDCMSLLYSLQAFRIGPQDEDLCCANNILYKYIITGLHSNLIWINTLANQVLTLCK